MRMMKIKKIIAYSGSIVASLFFMTAVGLVEAQTTPSCAIIQHDLFVDSRDSSFDGSIRLLQSYLVSAGYLKSPATGYFGPATLAAVKAFQNAHGLSPTGSANSLTRAAILQASCVKPTATPQPSAVPTTTATPSPQAQAASIAVTLPQAGTVLTEGKSYTIQWSGKAGTAYNILLEDMTGYSPGFISSNLHSNQYLWKVGDVYSSSNWASQTVAPGSYRIRVQNIATGSAASDQPSGPITLLGAPISLKYIIPSSVQADGNTSVVLYGSDFDGSTTVNLGSKLIHPVYITADGRALIFTVPPEVSPGVYPVKITNLYSSAPTILSLTVTGQ